MNEMMMFPFLVGLILSTAILSSIITTLLPHMGSWFNAFKYKVKRVLTRKPKTIEQHNIEVLVEKVNDLQEQVNNLVEVKYNRETNRKNNIRREVRNYLKELQNG